MSTSTTYTLLISIAIILLTCILINYIASSMIKNRRRKKIRSALANIAIPEVHMDRSVPVTSRCCLTKTGKKLSLKCRSSCEDNGMEPTTCDTVRDNEPWDCLAPLI